MALVDQFDHAITNELDFHQEAEHALRFARNFEGHAEVRFPKVYKEASSKQVLTLEFLPGTKVYEAMREHGHQGPTIAKTSIGVIIKMIFEDGFFHADPHPGNVMVLGTPEDPTIAMVDLGMVGRLSPRLRDLAVDLMIAAGRRDTDAIADVLYAMGTPTKKIDMNAYRAEVAMLSEKYLGKQLKDIEVPALTRDIAQGAMKFGVEIPTDFLLVGKALMTTEGVGKAIAPELDVLEEAKPFFIDLVKKRYSPERLGNELLRRLERLSGATQNLPEQIRDVLDDLRFGRLTVRTSDAGGDSATDRLGRRVYSGLIGSALIVSGTYALSYRPIYPAAALFAVAALWLFGHTVRDAWRSFRQK